MKKKLVLTAAVIAALSVVSCNGKKTNSQGADQDSLSYADNDSLNSNDVILDSIAGTYEGTLPAADCPGIKTVLTLNADSTYQYSADYLERKDGHDEASGIFKVLANNVVEITRPSSGETSYYKVKDANSLIMTDSLGNEPEGAMAKHYVLTRIASVMQIMIRSIPTMSCSIPSPAPTRELSLLPTVRASRPY